MKKKVALVTGSSKGIGQATALRLGKEGFFTYVTYRTDKVGGTDTVAAIRSGGGEASLEYLDVRSEASVQSLYKKVENEQGYLNVLINNAAIQTPNNIENISFDEWKAITETKINGAFLSAKYAIPLMKAADNANIIFITSVLGEKPHPNFLSYSVGTAGCIALLKALAVQLGAYHIRTNGITPAETPTPMWDNLGGRDNEQMWQKFAKNNPLGRFSTPEDVANAVMLIIDDTSNYLNGNIIYMDGGVHLK